MKNVLVLNSCDGHIYYVVNPLRFYVSRARLEVVGHDCPKKYFIKGCSSFVAYSSLLYVGEIKLVYFQLLWLERSLVRVSDA